jgi:hypothetical protein
MIVIHGEIDYHSDDVYTGEELIYILHQWYTIKLPHKPACRNFHNSLSLSADNGRRNRKYTRWR